MKDMRCRNWAFIAYEENITEKELISKINEEHIQFIVSPLHNQDVNPDGEPKKSHWHICLLFSGNKSYEQVCSISERVQGSFPIKVQSVKGMVRYFAHLDNPEKFQYDVSKIQYFGGLVPEDVLPLSSSERYKIIGDITDFIIDEDITSLTGFMKFVRTYHNDDWYPVICDSCFVMVKELIKNNWLNRKDRAGEDINL